MTRELVFTITAADGDVYALTVRCTEPEEPTFAAFDLQAPRKRPEEEQRA